MKIVQNIIKFSSIFTLVFMWQNVSAQVSKNSIIALEVARLFGIKTYDSYTLSYFTIKEGVQKTIYENGVLIQKKENGKVTHSKKATHTFDKLQKTTTTPIEYTDSFSIIDSAFSNRNLKKYAVQVQSTLSTFKNSFIGEMYDKESSFEMKQDTVWTINVFEDRKGNIIKKWNKNEQYFENIIEYRKGKKTSNILKNLNNGATHTILYEYDKNGLLKKEKSFKTRDSLNSNDVLNYELNYDLQGYKKSGIQFYTILGKRMTFSHINSLIVFRANFTPYTGTQFEFILDDNGFLKSYKQYHTFYPNSSYYEETRTSSGWHDIVDLNEEYELQSSGFFIQN